MNGPPEPILSSPLPLQPSSTFRRQLHRAGELFALVESSAWILGVLAVVDQECLPDAWVGAGVVRDLVLDTKFGAGFDASRVSDVDVIFFDSTDLSRERDEAARARLQDMRPDVRWDVKNQAAVHLWYPKRFGMVVPALSSIEEAVGTWPETATAVAIRRSKGGGLEIIAPLGLDDLLDGLWRRNPARVTPEEAALRLRKKDPQSRWPGVGVAPPDAPQNN